MKQALRPRYGVLLFLLLAATLGFWVVFDRSRCFHLKFIAPTARASPKVVFNKTLLDFAAMEAGEPRLKQEIEDLMEWNYFSRGRQRSFLASGKTDLRLKVRGIRGIPLQLRSPEFYRLWLSFQRYLGDWSRNRRFRSDALSNLVTEIKLLIDNHNGVKANSTGKYKTCAVVGNSGILLNHDYGKIIDGHEVVIRLNNARTRGFERNVGAKTSISFVNSNILHLCARRAGCSCHPYGEHIPLVMYICQPAHFFDFLICNSSHQAPLIITDPRFDVMCSRIVKYYSVKRFMAVSGKDPGEWATVHDVNFHYSSGMQAVMMAVGVCEKVSIFGYGKSLSARHHYHTNQKAELSLHDYEAEYDFYEDLIKKPQAIPFVSDKFKLPSVTIHR